MILLDDSQSTAVEPSSRFYDDPLQYWCVLPSGNDQQDNETTLVYLEEISEALKRGEFIVAAFAYELGRLFHKLPQRGAATLSSHPLIEAWSFKGFNKLSKQDVDLFINKKLAQLNDVSCSAGILNVRESINKEQFSSNITKIQDYLRSGDSYQINYTYRVAGEVYGSALALYARLRKRQPGRFGAYIQQRGRYLLSQSPELFIAREGDILKAMPMKGTASALSNLASTLSADPKNQAENVMIVDLLRNDLSRISLPGTVKVPNLFDVARHGDVLQMTSTVQGQVKPKTSLLDILNAVFPCGSVTGAPKKRSMEIIQDIEPQDRGYYCGALGWLDPGGDFALSVPIRTVEVTQNIHTNASTFTLGVGAGITIDSDADQEWQECHIKSAFLKNLPSQVGIFETIAIERGEPLRLMDHLHRMQSSAASLGISFNLNAAKSLIQKSCISLDTSLRLRLRLDLASNGECTITTGVLDALTQPVKLFWAKNILSCDVGIFSGDALLRHKISKRDLYDQAWQEAEKMGGFDALFTNEQGFVTEGGRSSVFIKPHGSSEWLTPPVSDGLLPGVMRAALLADPTMNARIASLTIHDVSMADEIILSNALRGAIKAHF